MRQILRMQILCSFSLQVVKQIQKMNTLTLKKRKPHDIPVQSSSRPFDLLCGESALQNVPRAPEIDVFLAHPEAPSLNLSAHIVGFQGKGSGNVEQDRAHQQGSNELTLKTLVEEEAKLENLPGFLVACGSNVRFTHVIMSNKPFKDYSPNLPTLPGWPTLPTLVVCHDNLRNVLSPAFYHRGLTRPLNECPR